jgi:hypothetical protein
MDGDEACTAARVEQGRRNDANFRFKVVRFNQGDVYNCNSKIHWEVVRTMKD